MQPLLAKVSRSGGRFRPPKSSLDSALCAAGRSVGPVHSKHTHTNLTLNMEPWRLAKILIYFAPPTVHVTGIEHTLNKAVLCETVGLALW